MSRDFILIFSGGMVSLVTTLVVLFVADFIARREQANRGNVSEQHPAHPPETIKTPPIKEDPTA